MINDSLKFGPADFYWFGTPFGLLLESLLEEKWKQKTNLEKDSDGELKNTQSIKKGRLRSRP